MSCYCKRLYESVDDLSKIKQTWKWTNHDRSVDTYSAPVCKEVYDDIFSSFSIINLWSTIFPYMVTINAFIIRAVMIWVAKQLKFKNLTEETNWIMLSIFIMYIFNYGFVYVFAAWDSREANLDAVQGFFGGVYTDINAYWFNDVGLMIVSTMIFNMYYPLIEFIGYWALRWLWRAIDQRSFCVTYPFKSEENKTNSKTLQAFDGIYAGPIFLIHWKYSFILNVVFICSLFGPIMPILFPIGLCSLIVLYVVERLMLAYSYQRPPMFDSTLNRTTLELMYMAPLIYAFSAAWNYSNQQLFMNKVVSMVDTSYYPKTDHFITQQWQQLTPGTPFAIMLAFLAISSLYRYFRTCLTKKQDLI